MLRAMTKLSWMRDKSGGEVFSDPVGEIILGGVVGEIGERQHDDGKMRGFGGAVRAEEIPGAGRDHDERHNPGDQRQERGALFRLGGLASVAGFAWAGTPTCSE